MSILADIEACAGQSPTFSDISNQQPSAAPKSRPKYSSYDCAVDPEDSDRAMEIKFCLFSRPHMRAFHCSFWGFFISCLNWFAITSLLPEIRDSLHLSNKEIWTSSVACFTGTLFMRLLLGPLSDRFGPRILFALTLCGVAVPNACIGLVHPSKGLTVVRLFIGFAGGTFVLCQSWANLMFANKTVGTAISVITGWGNLASGITQLIVGSVLFPLFKIICNDDVETAWRTVAIVPAVIACTGGVVIFMISEDTPRGNYAELTNHGAAAVEASALASISSGLRNSNAWILFLQNCCATGVELTIISASILYFTDQFGQSTEASAAIASILGWMGPRCAIGGYVSDKACSKMGIRGRLWVQTIVLACQGAMVLVFSSTQSLAGAITAMVFLSFFIQISEGTTYSIVHQVDRTSSGAISGIVSAGGSFGAIVFALVFRQLPYDKALNFMGGCVLISSVLSIFVNIEGVSMLFGGHDHVTMVLPIKELPVKDRSELPVKDGSELPIKDGGELNANDSEVDEPMK